MQNKIFKLMILLLSTAIITSCSDWTKVTPEVVVDYDNTEPARPASYYKALRDYKESDHSISFGWYSGWGEASSSTTSMLSGIPDSMDIVSLWNNSGNLSAGKIEDLRFVQNVKGTKVLICTFIANVGAGFTPPHVSETVIAENPDIFGNDLKKLQTAAQEKFWGWVNGDDVAIRASLVKYAGAMRDTVTKYGYNGIDVDFEPNFDGVPGKLDENDTYATWMFEELSKLFGPQSNSGRQLVLDGELWGVDAKLGICFDYFVAQAYSVSGGTPSPSAGQSESDMNRRLTQVINAFSEGLTEEEVTNRFVVTENLESAINALDGGYFWTLYNGQRLDKRVCPSMLGMAKWKPQNGFRKGGFGAYQFGYEAVNTPSYKWMRRGIQASNPAIN